MEIKPRPITSAPTAPLPAPEASLPPASVSAALPTASDVVPDHFCGGHGGIPSQLQLGNSQLSVPASIHAHKAQHYRDVIEFDKKDQNGDGSISESEVGPPSNPHEKINWDFKVADTDNNGVLSRSEYTAYKQKQRNSDSGLGF